MAKTAHKAKPAPKVAKAPKLDAKAQNLERTMELAEQIAYWQGAVDREWQRVLNLRSRHGDTSSEAEAAERSYEDCLMRRDARHMELRSFVARSPEAAFVKLDLRRRSMEAHMSHGFREALDELRRLCAVAPYEAK